MFPLDYKEPYIDSTGRRSTLGEMFAGAGADVAAVKAALDDEIETRAALGAHNRLKMSLADIKTLNTSGTWADNVYTWNDMSYTVNTDSSGNITSIKANGTASARGWLFISETDFATTAAVDFSSNAITSGYHFVNDNYVADKETVIFNNGSKRTYILIDNGRTVNNRMFYPLVTIEADNDTTYQPYAMTNKELTDAKLDTATLKSIVADSADFAAFKAAIAAL